MSLSDYVKRLRALRGGITPNEIEAATGIPAPTVGLIERAYRRVGEDDEVLAKLAAFFEVPVEEIQRQRENYRKRFTAFLIGRSINGALVRLTLTGGEELVGTVVWSDRAAFGLRPSDGGGATVVYRHAVDCWGDA